jgi:hypothetical protein
VRQPDRAWLFDVLGHLASSGQAGRRDTLQLALEVLATNSSGEAAAVLVALRQDLAEGDLSRPVLRSLILLAGTPELHGLALAYGRGRSRDARGLMLAVDVALHVLLETIGDMLLSGRGSSEGDGKGIWLPPGAVPQEATAEEHHRDNDRASAAVAARRVLTAVPGAAGVLVRQLMDSLKDRDVQDYGVSPQYEITDTLARLLLEQPTLVVGLLLQEGAAASGNFRERLMDVAERATRRLRPSRRKSFDTDEDVQYIDQVGDYPDLRLGQVDVAAVVVRLFGFALDRLGGDWGQRVGGDAGRLVTELVGAHQLELMAGGKGIYAVIGHLIEESRRGSVDSKSLSTPDPLAVLERMSTRQTHASLMRDLRKALAAFANVDVNAVLDVVEPLLDVPMPTTDSPPQSDQTHGHGGGHTSPPDPDAVAQLDVRAELMELLGDLAYSHGLIPCVLGRILPRLTTHLLAGGPLIRATAIRALAEAYRGEQQLPSTFSDLMPALLGDPYLIVISALLDVLPSLVYRPGCIDGEHLPLIIRWALLIEPEIRANSQHDVEDVISVLHAVASRYDDPMKTRLLTKACAFGKDLPGYDLKDHLETHWPAQVAQSADFAELCVRAIQDPDSHDGGDEVLTLLLDAWPGADTLRLEQITALADLTPAQYPLAAAHYVELLGRCGRHEDAAALARHILDRVAPVPANDTARAIAIMVCCAADLEVALASLAVNGAMRSGPAPKWLLPEAELRRAEASIVALRAEFDRPERSPFGLNLPRHEGPADRMLATVAARCAAVRALGGLMEGALRADDEDGAASACAAAAASLRAAYPQDLPTADAHRFYADALDIVEGLVRADAATQRADGPSAASQIQAAHRKGALLAEHIASAQADGISDVVDPLTAGLVAFAMRARDAAIGDIPGLSRDLLSIGLPIRVIELSWRSRRRRNVTTPSKPTPEAQPVPAMPTPVAVCLLSLDDQPLIEHDQVLQSGKVYTLSIEVRGSGWPTWADTLELELVSQVNAEELTRPSFVFARPRDLAEDADYQLTGSGLLILRFTLPPGRPAVAARVTGLFRQEVDPSAGSNDGQHAALNIAGHAQVRLRPFDPSRDGSTTFPQVDGRLLELFGRLRGRYPDEQVETFARFLTAIAHAAAQIQFDKTYKLGTRVSEASFHDDIESRLRGDATLEGRLTRRNPRGGGFLDLDHDQITAELKVERDTPVTPENCAKYLGQPTQYATSADKRLSILVVLDMSRKASPPGALENYVWLMEPSLHGLTDPAYPSIVGVLVINANNRVPSGYAGKRIEAKVVEPAAGLICSPVNHVEPFAEREGP